MDDKTQPEFTATNLSASRPTAPAPARPWYRTRMLPLIAIGLVAALGLGSSFALTLEGDDKDSAELAVDDGTLTGKSILLGAEPSGGRSPGDSFADGPMPQATRRSGSGSGSGSQSGSSANPAPGTGAGNSGSQPAGGIPGGAPTTTTPAPPATTPPPPALPTPPAPPAPGPAVLSVLPVIDLPADVFMGSFLITNTGGSVLNWYSTYELSPLTLGTTSGSIAPGASQLVSFTIDPTTATYFEFSYLVSLTSNGGNAPVTIVGYKTFTMPDLPDFPDFPGI